ncbi:MAG TPA: tyrosine-type recombinase/integrase, partial [Polyangiaceae bacterium]|nr:tyrosine-type recombinase/integrase [Polyangiaceae bacterium]
MAKPTRFRDKWRIRWIDAAGKRQSDVLHDYKAAAHALRCREVEAEEVRRGLRSPEPEDRTFGELCDYWIEKRASRKRSGKDDKSIIERHLRPAFGPMKLRAIGVEEVDDFVLSKDHLEEKTIANHVTLLISMMRLATTFKMPWLLVVPKYNKPKTTLFSTDYSYLRTEEEIRRFLMAAREEGEHVLVLYATAIFTGLRAGELAALEWDDVDFAQRRITVQR